MPRQWIKTFKNKSSALWNRAWGALRSNARKVSEILKKYSEILKECLAKTIRWSIRSFTKYRYSLLAIFIIPLFSFVFLQWVSLIFGTQFLRAIDDVADLTQATILILGIVIASLSYREVSERGKTYQIVESWNTITKKAPGASGKGKALEFLVQAEESLNGIDLSSETMGGNVFLGRLDLSKQTHGESISLQSAILTGVDLTGAILEGTNLTGADLKRADLTGAYLNSAYLNGANLTEANLTEANLTGANLKSANLFEANLKSANLFEANLKSANLTGANLNSANLNSANLTGANLFAANLFEANLTGANLSGANLTADLSEAHLNSANLSGADLSEAQLKSANLSGADLTGANLTSANLTGANLSGANLEDAFYSSTHPTARSVRPNMEDAKLSRNWEEVTPDGTIVRYKGKVNGKTSYEALKNGNWEPITIPDNTKIRFRRKQS